MKKSIYSMIFGGIIGIGVGAVAIYKVLTKIEYDIEGKLDKFKQYYYLLNSWMKIKEEGKSLKDYINDNGYDTIAIYGIGEVGKRLYFELRYEGVDIAYIIDNSVGCNNEFDLEIRKSSDNLEEVDAVIVTVPFAFEKIKDEISKKLCCPIISIVDMIDDIAIM